MIGKTLFILLNLLLLSKGEFPKNNYVYTLDHSNFHSFFENSEVVIN